MATTTKDDPQAMPPFFADCSQDEVDIKVEQKTTDDFGKDGKKKLKDGESKELPPQRGVGWDTK